jgi:hypothetical protein
LRSLNLFLGACGRVGFDESVILVDAASSTPTDADGIADSADLTTTSSGSGGSSGDGGQNGSSGGTSGTSGSDASCSVNTSPAKTGATATALSGKNGWSNPDNARVSDGLSASATLNDDSTALVITGFGLAIPASAEIQGVTVRVLHRAASGVITDESFNLTGTGLSQGINHRMAAWPTTFTNDVYGGPTDLWGQALTPAVVNDPSFGVSLRANSGSAAKTNIAEVDAITIEITYCD